MLGVSLSKLVRLALLCAIEVNIPAQEGYWDLPVGALEEHGPVLIGPEPVAGKARHDGHDVHLVARGVGPSLQDAVGLSLGNRIALDLEGRQLRRLFQDPRLQHDGPPLRLVPEGHPIRAEDQELLARERQRHLLCSEVGPRYQRDRAALALEPQHAAQLTTLEEGDVLCYLPLVDIVLCQRLRLEHLLLSCAGILRPQHPLRAIAKVEVHGIPRQRRASRRKVREAAVKQRERV
mmetsp:Transcript_25160/g.79267  ORF Transcript_25160/g.79267 Transcript_25160/m.79267 type:complete len:235 (+) Transcript_25160:2768-3472(+)